MTSAQQVTLIVAGVIGGAAIGSFVCVIIDRLPYRLDEPNEFGDEYGTRPWGEVLGGSSRCSSCGAGIGWTRKIPILSWLALRGRCADCGERIPAFHPFVEFAVPALWVVAILLSGWQWQVLPLLLVVPSGVAIAVIDWRTRIVPTRLVWPTFFLVVISSVAVSAIEGQWGWLWGAAIGVALMAGPLAILWFVLPGSMGFGDVRLATLLGWAVGFAAYSGRWTHPAFIVVLTMAVAAILGTVMGVGALISQGRKAKVPFGPALFLAALFVGAGASSILRGFELI